MAIKTIEIEGYDHPLCIEVDDDQLDITIGTPRQLQDAPTGAEPTSATKDLVDSMAMLRDNIGILATQVKAALEKHQPDEWSAEFNVGFKGEGGIPFILKGEANTAIKITAKWKKSTEG